MNRYKLVPTGTNAPLFTVNTAVPEPSAALLGALGCIALLRRKRA